jgi:putative transposase
MEALEEQIRVLKNIVAKQQIEIEFKTELLNLPAGRQEKVNP